jgi:hypothetical protein
MRTSSHLFRMNPPPYVIIGQYHRRTPVPLPMQRRFLLLVIPLLMLLPLLFAASPSLAQAGSPYELIATVNQLRSTNGLGALNADGALMAAAQSQSDYQASIGSFTHSGEGGSTPRERAVAAGYGSSGVTENIAGGMDLSPGGAIAIWSRDALHTNTMLGNYTDIGASAAPSPTIAARRRQPTKVIPPTYSAILPCFST